MSYPVIPWHNENALTEYPLVKSYGYNGFLVDAQFIQFDDFVPSLKTIKVNDTNVDIVITLQTGDLLSSIPIIDFQDSPFNYELVIGDSYLGFLSFGVTAYTMLTTEMVNLVTKTLNIPFLGTVVKSIPSQAGLYSLNGRYGALTLSETDEVHFNQTGQEVVMDIYTLPTESDVLYLKTLNSIPPVDNSVNLILPDVVKLSAQGASALELSLIGSTGPTSLNNIIVTDG